ncbi:MAG: RNA recognition motif 2-domain-containing protein [Piptocephalis tieghemiana]|nr:MAG: RNA recognition motif 2-domain-containing protein [Piptocephalis tieghemiana]
MSWPFEELPRGSERSTEDSGVGSNNLDHSSDWRGLEEDFSEYSGGTSEGSSEGLAHFTMSLGDIPGGPRSPKVYLTVPTSSSPSSSPSSFSEESSSVHDVKAEETIEGEQGVPGGSRDVIKVGGDPESKGKGVEVDEEVRIELAQEKIRRADEGYTGKLAIHPANRVYLKSIIKGSDRRTTFMIRNIPNRYTQSMLLDLLMSTHAGEFDFFYLRMDFITHSNVGYAFVNFINPAKSVLPFVEHYVNKLWSLPGYVQAEVV